ncbi:MAG: hypothetical protein DHS20C16_02300 [Phycisphaerae bacterium]|nr:MAG: hypothetical protein DHS20C16_02300 [Phycisphaerae bacterium]
MKLPGEIRKYIDQKRAEYKHLVNHIDRQFLITLHQRSIVSIDQMHEEVRALAGKAPLPAAMDHNQAEGEKLSADEHEWLVSRTYDYVCKHLGAEEVERIINLTIKRDVVRELDDFAKLASVSTKLLAEKVRQFTLLSDGENRLPASEVLGTRVALIRHFISDQLEFIGIAKNFVTIRDIDEIAERMIGLEFGQGRIGGKAGGMVLASCILETFEDLHPDWPVATPESWFLRSDVIDRFLELNHLTGYQSLKYRTTDEIRHEYPLVKGVFRNSDFPVEIVQQLRSMLKEIGMHPLIVRSSSLLEDRIGSAFSGKYASVFVANQGPLEVRLQALLVAISEVYASTMSPDPIAYRRERNLLDYHEDMGVLIQKVVGKKVGKYFVPAFAGVAFSRNEYRWSPRIKREDGLLRLVMGLGTRAVDRVGHEHPRMVALGAPTLKPTASDQATAQTAQRTVDVINLEMNRMQSIDAEELLSLDDAFPRLDQIVSVYADGILSLPTSTRISAPPSNLCVTFDKLLERTTFADAMRRILVRLEEAYGFPVDVEFAHDGEKLYLLQCRALASKSDVAAVQVPDDIPDDQKIFSANKYVRTGLLADIEYVVYVDPSAYDAIETHDRRIEVARVVGRVNHALANKRFVLVGPGRWGSNDIRLGVKVGYSDINETCMLVEVARTKAGYTPEVSFGTHFFQDLVEADIQYLPLYPDEPGTLFSDSFFGQSENTLESLVPKDADFAEIVRVIHVPSVTSNQKLHIAMNGETDEALAYLR